MYLHVPWGMFSSRSCHIVFIVLRLSMFLKILSSKITLLSQHMKTIRHLSIVRTTLTLNVAHRQSIQYMTFWPNVTSYTTIVTYKNEVSGVIPVFRNKFDGFTILMLLWLGGFGLISNISSVPRVLLIQTYFLNSGHTCLILLESQTWLW